MILNATVTYGGAGSAIAGQHRGRRSRAAGAEGRPLPSGRRVPPPLLESARPAPMRTSCSSQTAYYGAMRAAPTRSPSPLDWRVLAWVSRPASPSEQGYGCSGRDDTLARGCCSATPPWRSPRQVHGGAPFSPTEFMARSNGARLRRPVLLLRLSRHRSRERWRLRPDAAPGCLTGIRCLLVQPFQAPPQLHSGLRPSLSGFGNGHWRLREHQGLRLLLLVLS